ncbi:MAG: hypothetical protein NC935_01090, partial [Candidatus Omnitrophica bacterium]|nr:hypothetical protein [Candidatus Omnitrophota bacterium]
MDNKNYILKEDGSFVIKNYNQLPPFSNFLPGIAGVWGIPLWVFYVNRGQGIISFGIKDKDHSILEFFPANNAYALAPFVGFRTFIKINKKIFYEPFKVISDHNRTEIMIIKSNSLEIQKINHNFGLEFSIKYFTLPNYPVGALIRMLKIKNISEQDLDLDIIDGLVRIIPFGTSNMFLKELTRTIEAWMYSSFLDNIALFRLIIDPTDTSQTKYIEGANFNYAFWYEDKKKVYPFIIIDPSIIFAQDASYGIPVNFIKEDFKLPTTQVNCGRIPSSLSYFNWRLSSGQERTFYSIFGSSFKLEPIKKFIPQITEEFLQKKEVENEKIIEEIKENTYALTNFPSLNNYVPSCYLDNILRGGLPYKFDGSNFYYIFGRKHGDLERDYNKFNLLPSYFSEGEANYRDINQNRRIDLFFNPFIYNKNIIYFLNYLKIDGYNPLVIKGQKLFFDKKTIQKIFKKFNIPQNQNLIKLAINGFYLGEFFKALEENGIFVDDRLSLAIFLVKESKKEPIASFGEGYWIDHWRYNLDLIENFLYFYPDKTKELFLKNEYYFWDDEYRVKPRNRRYCLKNGKVYQLNSIEVSEEKRAVISKRTRYKNFLRTKSNTIYKTNLIVKLTGLILNKISSQDPEGIGVEMEADKPGWCDSLNGLPALFGSSLCETLEVKRAALILLDALKYLEKVKIKYILFPLEIAQFLTRINIILDKYFSLPEEAKDFFWWQNANNIKEAFRRKTFFNIDGKERRINIKFLQKFLNRLLEKLNIAICKAKDKKTNFYTTYFTYQVTKFSQNKS